MLPCRSNFIISIPSDSDGADEGTDGWLLAVREREEREDEGRKKEAKRDSVPPGGESGAVPLAWGGRLRMENEAEAAG